MDTECFQTAKKGNRNLANRDQRDPPFCPPLPTKIAVMNPKNKVLEGVSKTKPGNKAGNKTTMEIQKSSIHAGFKALLGSDNRTISLFTKCQAPLETRLPYWRAGFLLAALAGGTRGRLSFRIQCAAPSQLTPQDRHEQSLHQRNRRRGR